MCILTNWEFNKLKFWFDIMKKIIQCSGIEFNGYRVMRKDLIFEWYMTEIMYTYWSLIENAVGPRSFCQFIFMWMNIYIDIILIKMQKLAQDRHL